MSNLKDYQATLAADVKRYQEEERRIALERDLTDILYENLMLEAEQRELLEQIVAKQRARIRELEQKLMEITRNDN